MKIFLSLVCLAIGGIVVDTMGARLKRVSSGKRISIEDAPHVVSLRENGFHICSGAIISTEHVLTVAHCVLDELFRPLYHIRVVSGTDQFDLRDVGRKIGEIIPHDDFRRGNSSCDIAVVTLLMPFEWDGKRNRIELPNAGPRGSVVATLTGFKLLRYERTEGELQELSVRTRPISPTSNNTDDSDQVFYGALKRPQSISNPDFGGALVHDKKVIGIAYNFAEKSRYACWFINVAKFKTFIEQSMEKSSNLEHRTVILWAPKRARH